MSFIIFDFITSMMCGLGLELELEWEPESSWCCTFSICCGFNTHTVLNTLFLTHTVLNTHCSYHTRFSSMSQVVCLYFKRVFIHFKKQYSLYRLVHLVIATMPGPICTLFILSWEPYVLQPFQQSVITIRSCRTAGGTASWKQTCFVGPWLSLDGSTFISILVLPLIPR